MNDTLTLMSKMREYCLQSLQASKTLKELTGKGIISNRLGRVMEYMIALDVAIVGAENSIFYGRADIAIEELMKAKQDLEGMYSVPVSRPNSTDKTDVERKTVRLDCAVMERIQIYKPLFEIAKIRYDEALKKLNDEGGKN